MRSVNMTKEKKLEKKLRVEGILLIYSNTFVYFIYLFIYF